MANLFGTGINQVPTNGMLGNLAFQDKAFVSVDKIGIGTTAVDTGTANQTLQNYGGAYISGNIGIGTTNPPDSLTVLGRVQIQQNSGSNNRLVFRGQPGSSYRWSIDNNGASNDFRIFREDDLTTANGVVYLGISTTGTVSATRFSGDGSLLTGITASSSGVVVQNQGSPVGTAGTLNFSTNLTASFSSGTATISLSNNPSISGILTADQVYTSNNGNGTNIRIGDDAWLGDINVANTTRLSGVQNSDRAFIIFGSSDTVSLGRTGTGPLYYGGNFTVAGVVTASSFSGNASSATYATSAGVSSDVIGGIGSLTQLQVTGVTTSTGGFVGNLTGTATTASSVTANSVGLGTHTYGDYVKDITGTANQITVTSGIGEGSSPTLSIPSQFTAPQDVTITRDLQVNRNLNVTGNITIGGTSATLFTTEFKVYDPDIVLGFRTDGSGNDVSTDNTANHGGIAIASTEGTPLISLYDVGVGETNPSTYKKFMWFKSGTFSGLGTDAWISNYAIGIGSTQVPNGVRLAAGGMQVTDSTLSVPQLNISGVSTFTGAVSFGTSAYFGDNDIAYFGDGNDLQIYHNGSNSIIKDAGTGILVIGGSSAVQITNANLNEFAARFLTDGAVELYYDNTKEFETTGYGATVFGTLQSQQINVSGVTTSTGGFVGNLTGTATTATNLADAANITTGTINSARLSGTYDINVSYASTAGIATVAQGLTGTPNITVGVVTATSFVKSGGTSSEFLKADGSVDSSTYLTTTGSGTNLTGIVTSIVAGTNITVSGSTGQVTINSTATGSATPLDILEVMLFA